MRLTTEAGFGLVEVVIASGMLAVVVGAITVFMQQSSDNLVYRSARIEQQRLYQSIKSDLQKFDKIKFSATKGSVGNIELNRCLNTNPAKTQDCSATSAGAQVGFQLWVKMGLNDIQRTDPLAGGMNYSLQGVRNCVVGSAYCPFWKAESFFWATCPGGVEKCDQASNIHVRHIIKAAKETFRDVPVPSLPPAAEFDANKTKFAYSHYVTKGRQIIENQTCPVGALVSGTEDDGKIVCKCRGGFKEESKGPPIVCKPLPTMCGPDQRIKGRNKDGSVNCVDQERICKTVSFDPNSATCPVGGWLEGINLGYCRPAKKNKKGTKRGIKCDTNQGTCCYFDEK